MIVHYDKETDNLLRKKKLSKGKETATRSANSRSDGRGPSVEILVENLNFQGSKASFWYYDFSHWAHGRAHNLYDGDVKMFRTQDLTCLHENLKETDFGK
ncbi:hypothetical protein VIGAN_07096600 [Vigna angularis var. angularis]|uniref:Uncharacterized protein n=1 Tax=Vigna angularis var. angularis TaxID=157739 RepID=A0A0S3SHK7_PHAAN|nr:hypothetical protein VIGAN_07096600 [Vigna angularis var. angularis]